MPNLGPPLPGDLGKPIVNAGAPAPPVSPDPLAQEQEAALKSQLFIETNYRQLLGSATPAASASGTHSA